MGNATGVIIFVLKEIQNEFHILFLRRSGGRFEGEWWPVAGTCEKEETPLTTVMRELNEETGLSPEKIYPFGMQVKHVDKVSRLDSFVVIVSPESEVCLNYEHSTFMWATVQKAIEIVPEPIRTTVHHVEHMRHIESNFVKRAPDDSQLIWCA